MRIITFKDYILLFKLALVCLVFISCNKEEKIENSGQNRANQDYINYKTSVNKSKKNETKNIIQIQKKSLVFFMINSNEYNKLIRNTGYVNKYEFDIMFRDFKIVANAAKSMLNKKGIYSMVTTKPSFEFTLSNGEVVVFDRESEDMIIGQIFFDGESKPKVEEGVIKRHNLRELIRAFFKLEDVGYFPVDTLRVRIDTTSNNVSDSVNNARLNRFLNKN